jgi:hypothetical protein
MIIRFAFFFCMIFLYAHVLPFSCALAQTPAPTPIWTAFPTIFVPPTQTPLPTITPRPTRTPLPPTPTFIPSPTVAPTWTTVPTPIPNVTGTPTPTFTPTLSSTPLALPQAVGAGKFTQGGRGGSVCKVTTSADNDVSPTTGMLRHCLQNVSGPRYIVFDGVNRVNLVKMLELNSGDSNVTVFGQSAPAGAFQLDCRDVAVAGTDWGNCVRNYSGGGGWNQVIWQYTKFRSGDLTNAILGTHQQEGHAISLFEVNNHYWFQNSFTGGQDETVTMANAEKITFHGNLIGAGTTYDHFSACLISYASSGVALPDDVTEQTYFQNFFTHCMDRMPEIKIKGAEVINNLLHYSNSMRQALTFRGGTSADVIGNKFKGYSFLDSYIRAQGPGTNTLDSGATGDPQFFIEKNITPFLRDTDNSASNRKIVRWTTESTASGTTRLAPTPVAVRTPHRWTGADKIKSIAVAEPTIIANVGASMYINPAGTPVPARDALDKRLIKDWKNNRAIIPNYDNQPVPIPTPPSGSSRTDSDNDGMHDSYEIAKYGNLTRDQNYDQDGDGYTAIEEYYLGRNPAVKDHF